MRVPPFDQYRRLTHGLGVFLLGMLIGAVVYNGIFLAKFEALITQKGELEDKLNQRDQDIRQLNRFKNQHTVIKSIQTYIEENRSAAAGKSLDTRTEAELKSRIKKDLSNLMGRSIYDIDSDARLVRTLLGRKVYLGIYERDFDVEIKTMLVVDNILKVWVSASEHIPD